MIPEAYRGVRFRQVCPYLRWFVGEGFSHMEESWFPSNAEGVFYPPAEPIYLTFPDDMHGLEIDRQLRTGGLVIDDPSKRREARAERAAPERMSGAPPSLGGEGGGQAGES